MTTRISENMKYTTMVNNLFRVQDNYNKLMEKMSSQKTINRLSDDPLGMSKIMGYKESKSTVENYRCNVNSSKVWITMTESKLSGVNNILVRAREIALSQSTATASAETRKIAAVEVQQIIEEVRGLANSKYGDRYLFAGAKMDEYPFSSSESAPAIGEVAKANGNGGFDGTVTAGGTYTGAVNKTYVVRIVTDNEPLAATEYQVSDDGGKIWGTVKNDLADGVAVALGDGVELTFTEGTTANLAENDIFYIHAYAGGYYSGNGEELSVEIGKDMTFNYSIPGESVFTDKGEGEVDIFKTLNDLRIALESDDPGGIASQINALKSGSGQVNEYIAKCGSRINRLEIAESNLADLDFKLTELISNTEDVDVAELITKFSMQEIVLKAAWTMASRIGNITILDFLR